MHLDVDIEPVRMLRVLAAGAHVAGGSFASWLPNPATLDRPARRAVVEQARSEATVLCLRSLVHLAGLPQQDVQKSPGGARCWPPGFAGSVTNKGTVVLAVLTTEDRCAGIGIDLERADGANLVDVPGIGSAQNPPPGILDDTTALLIAFSLKEAVFKAFYPRTSIKLAFEDVSLQWQKAENLTADCLVDGVTLTGRCAFAPPWVVSVARWHK